MGETVYLDGRVVGRVEDGVFRRRVKANQVLRQPPAIALHVDVIRQLRHLGCHTVVFDMPDGRILTGAFGLYEAHGFEFDRGAGRQTAVKLEHFTAVSVPVPVRASGLGW